MFATLSTKILRVLIVLLGATLITFFLIHAIPGNPWGNFAGKAQYNLNLALDEKYQQSLSRQFGLDLPLWRQYTRYIFGDVSEEGTFVCGAVCGNLGLSLKQRGRTVNDVLFAPPEGRGAWDSRFGYSVRMVLLGALIAVGLGIPLGVLSGLKPLSPASRAIAVSLAALVSIPNFVLGLLAIILFVTWLGIMKVLPDWNNPAEWIIPAFVLAAMPMASVARVTSATIANVMNEDYIRTARGKGAPEDRILRVHVFGNALVPVLTFLGPTAVELFTGLFIVESLYAFPGLGREFWTAVLNLDYPIILALTLIYATGIAVVNIVVETLSQALDPRLRAIEQQGAA